MSTDSGNTGFSGRLQWLVAVVTILSAPVSPAAASMVEIIGHRGNSSAAPENTIAAINSAFDIGADHVGVDIRLTSDGHAVLIHDGSVDRTTDGIGAIDDMTLVQAQLLDAGSWFGLDFVGASVPSLADALIAVNHRGRILLDIKVGGMGASIQAALEEASAATDGSFASDDLWIWPGPNSSV